MLETEIMSIFGVPFVTDGRKENQDMKSMELQKSLLTEITAILDDEEMTKKVLQSIRRLKAKMNREAKKEEVEVKPYTVEEFKASVAEGVADARAGRETPSENMFKRMEEKYPWLRE